MTFRVLGTQGTSVLQISWLDENFAELEASLTTRGYRTFTSNGVFTVPANVTQLRVWILGAGGGGASGSAWNGWIGGAGGGGGAAFRTISGVTAGDTFGVTLGQPGAGGAGVPSAAGQNGNSGAAGSATSFYTINSAANVTMTALGGAGAPRYLLAGYTTPAAGGTASGGDVVYTGASGEVGFVPGCCGPSVSVGGAPAANGWTNINTINGLDRVWYTNLPNTVETASLVQPMSAFRTFAGAGGYGAGGANFNGGGGAPGMVLIQWGRTIGV